ncbi:MAG: HAD family phosphatase, partial [Chloroflexi bacterium]
QKSTEEHWQWLGRHFGLSASALAEMRRDFFAGDALNRPLLDYVAQLRRAGYKTGLLSNFGDNARRVWREVYPFIDQFDAAVISAEEGMMKPDPRIYRLAAARLNVEPGEAVFVDDFIENVRGAQAVGMPAIHFTGTDDAIRQLSALLEIGD